MSWGQAWAAPRAPRHPHLGLRPRGWRRSQSFQHHPEELLPSPGSPPALLPESHPSAVPQPPSCCRVGSTPRASAGLDSSKHCISAPFPAASCPLPGSCQGRKNGQPLPSRASQGCQSPAPSAQGMRWSGPVAINRAGNVWPQHSRVREAAAPRSEWGTGRVWGCGSASGWDSDGKMVKALSRARAVRSCSREMPALCREDGGEAPHSCHGAPALYCRAENHHTARSTRGTSHPFPLPAPRGHHHR